MGDESNKRGSWEDAWQQAFEGSAKTPPPRVWQGLENTLMEQQLGHYRRRLALYQWLAAASVVLLGLWVGWWLVVADPFTQTQGQTQAVHQQAADGRGNAFSLQQVQQQQQQPVIASSAPASEERSNTALDLTQSGFGYHYAFPLNDNAFLPGSSLFFSPGRYKSVAGVGLRPYYAGQDEALSAEQGALPLSLAYLASIKAELALQSADLDVAINGVPVAIAIKNVVKKKSWQPNGNVWLGVSVASTFFSPNINTSNNGIASITSPQPTGGKSSQVYTANVDSWNEKENSLPSMDFRLDANYRIRPRWMLQGSLQYGSYRVNTLAGTFVDPNDEKSYPLYYSNFSFDRLQVASPNSRRAMPVEAINKYNFIRLPLSLNYVLYDRAFGVALSSGLSTDVFLGSTIQDQANRLQDYNVTAGEDSPFHRFHFSGQLGLQLYYRAGHNYLITLEPNYQRALTDFSKTNGYFNSRPSQFGVAAGFRFILQ